MIKTLDHLIVAVKDLEKAEDSYKKIFGKRIPKIVDNSIIIFLIKIIGKLKNTKSFG